MYNDLHFVQAKVGTKDAQIIKLTADVSNREELLGQAQQKNVQVENEFKKVTEHSAKLQVSCSVCTVVVSDSKNFHFILCSACDHYPPEAT